MADVLKRVARKVGYLTSAAGDLRRDAELNERRALTWLAEQVRTGHVDDLDVREFAGHVFGKEAEPTTLGKLHDVLGGQDDEPTRLAAGRLIYAPSTLAGSLLRSGRPALTGALGRGLLSGDRRVRDACLWAVFKLGEGDLRELGAALLPASDDDARFELVRVLGFTGDRRVTPVLVDALAEEPSAKIRSAILWALGTLADPRALQPCIDALEDADAETRGYAAWALGTLRDPAALPALRRAMSDSDRDVRKWVEEAVRKLEFPK